MKGKLVLSITAVVAICLTVALYYAVVTEWTSKVLLSLGVVCLSELAILGTLGLLPVLNFKNGSTGIMVDIYAALMIIWSLTGCIFSGKVYLIGLIVISLIMLVLIGISVMGSHESDRLNAEAEQVIECKQTFTSSAATPANANAVQPNLSAMWLAIQAAVDDADTKKRLRILVDRIRALPANTFPDTVIETSMKEITAMSRGLSHPDARERLLGRINGKAKELTDYIKTL